MEAVEAMIRRCNAAISAALKSPKVCEVDCINNRYFSIKSLDFWKPVIEFKNSESLLAFTVVIVFILFSDHSLVPLFLKIWMLFSAAMIYFLWRDHKRKRIVYKIESRLGKRKIGAGLQQSVSFAEDNVYSMVQSTFSILHVKLEETSTDAKIYFNVTTSNGDKRWSVWRTYDDFYECYLALQEKHAEILNIKLISLKKLKKSYKKMVSEGLAASALVNTADNVAAAADDNKVFNDMAFFHVLQNEILAWIYAVQRDLQVADDELVLKLLNFPLADKVNQSAAVAAAHEHRMHLHNNPYYRRMNARHRPTETVKSSLKHSSHDGTAHSNQLQVIAPLLPERESFYDVSILHQKQHEGNGSPAMFSDYGQESPLDLPAEAPVSSDGTWKGTNMFNLEFLDLAPEQRAMFRDPAYLHTFRVRGQNYMQDKKKVDAGPPVSRMLLMEFFKVDTAKYGDRIDHIASIGKCRKRVDIIRNLPDKPFVFVVNIQIPGDPPICVVFYFAVPLHGKNGIYEREDLRKIRNLFKRFIDIPLDEVVPPEQQQQKDSKGVADNKATATKNGDKPPAGSTAAVASHLSEGIARVDNASSKGGNGQKRHAEQEEEDGYATPEESEGVGAEGHSPLVSGKEEPTQAPALASAASAAPPSLKNRVRSVSNDGEQHRGPPAQDLKRSATVDVGKQHGEHKGEDGKGPKHVTETSWASDIVWPEPGPDQPGVLGRKAFQNLRFKLIPYMVEAPWIVQMAVSSTPVILGQKIVTRYFRGVNYLEVDMHIGSSAVANRVVGLCRSYCNQYICDLAIVLQGEADDELPEKLLACGTLVKVDVNVRSVLE